MLIFSYIFISVLGCLFGIYFVLIGPILFRFWIIPKIEHRHKVRIRIHYPALYFPSGSTWGMPPLEMSIYIFCKYTGWEWPIKRYDKSLYTIFKQIDNYDIKTASKAEIVVSFLTMFAVFFLIFAGFFMGLIDYLDIKPR